jgi:hypothetical protein
VLKIRMSREGPENSIYIYAYMKYTGLKQRQKHTWRHRKGEAENVYLTSQEMTVGYARAEIWTRGMET